MGRVGEVICRTWQTAAKNLWRISLEIIQEDTVFKELGESRCVSNYSYLSGQCDLRFDLSNYNNIVHIISYNIYINKYILWFIPTRWSAELHTVVLSFLRWDLECWPENNTQGTVSTYHMYCRYEISTVHARCSIIWHVLHLYITTCHTRNMSLYISSCTMLNARVQCHQYGLTYATANEHHFTICRLSLFLPCIDVKGAKGSQSPI